MYGLIYLITCLVNGKKYVGQTTKTVEKRFKEHVRRKKSLISKAIHEFGVENFTVEVLEECETSEQLLMPANVTGLLTSIALPRKVTTVQTAVKVAGTTRRKPARELRQPTQEKTTQCTVAITRPNQKH